MAKFINTGYAEFMATNGYDVIQAKYYRGRTKVDPIAPHWSLLIRDANGLTNDIRTVYGNKDDAMQTAEEILSRPGKLPMTVENMKYQCKGYDYCIHGIVPVDLKEIINNDLEALLDILSERLTGDVMLTDINYAIVGHDKNTVFLRVSGDARDIIDSSEGGTNND